VSPVSAWSEVKDATLRPARSAGVIVTDSGDGGSALATFLAEKKLI
jgi:electron transfer flavoprotein beta subunit